MAKIESLMNVRDAHDGTPNWHERAKSLAIFSAFTEGVNLFSSFAVLLSFKLENKLKGVGQIVEWSVRDESLHSDAGCWLFRTMMEEHPKMKTKKLQKEIAEAAHLALKLEFDFEQNHLDSLVYQIISKRTDLINSKKKIDSTYKDENYSYTLISLDKTDYHDEIRDRLGTFNFNKKIMKVIKFLD